MDGATPRFACSRVEARCIGAVRTALAYLLLAFGLAAASPARAQDADAEAAIRAALESWRVAFNTGKADGICDLFAPELRYDYQGLPEQTYTQLCDRLHRALSGAGPTFQYGVRIKEVIVSGDLAVVRLTWHSTMADYGKTSIEDQPGLDVFRRSADGRWRIIRYMAYTASP